MTFGTILVESVEDNGFGSVCGTSHLLTFKEPSKITENISGLPDGSIVNRI